MQKRDHPDGECLPEQRQRLILEHLERDGRVVARALAQKFRTSEDTIRRDLRELAAAGHCQRVYGGALPLSPANGSLAERVALMPARKRALGEALASLLSERQTVFVDAGSTNLAALRALPEGLRLTIVTNAPALAAEVAGRQSLQVLLIGGLVDPRSGSAFGARALRDIGELRPDIYLLGACALDAGAGIAVFGCDEAEFKRALVAQARRVICAATNDKLGTSAPFGVAPLRALSDLIVEADAPSAQIDALQDQGLHLRRAAALAANAS